jgi:hypothetical protein
MTAPPGSVAIDGDDLDVRRPTVVARARRAARRRRLHRSFYAPLFSVFRRPRSRDFCAVSRRFVSKWPTASFLKFKRVDSVPRPAARDPNDRDGDAAHRDARWVERRRRRRRARARDARVRVGATKRRRRSAREGTTPQADATMAMAMAMAMATTTTTTTTTTAGLKGARGPTTQ